MKKLPVILFFILYSTNCIFAQNTDEFVTFKHKNGRISSEGYMRNGKPDGYWKTYNEEGELISEGNRKDFLLDSIWYFYQNNKKTSEISYQYGKKNGVAKNFSDNEIIETPYINDIINGEQRIYFLNFQLKKITPFEKGVENGRAYDFSEDGRIIGITDYKKGFIVSRQRFNKKDGNGLKQGEWKFFYPTRKLQEEGNFINDKKNGWFKTYDTLGNLVSVDKYVNGDLEAIDEKNPTQIEIKTTYFPNGQQKLVAPYKNGVLEGIAREYDEQGNVVKGIVFKDGKPVSSGIVDNRGQFQGDWKEFYDDGALKASGKFKNGKKIGEWKYYFHSGELEQVGIYDKNGNIDGEWIWYYKSGTEHIIQNFFENLPEGEYVEYDETGKVLAKGNYAEGEKAGNWTEHSGNEIMEGKYRYGEQQGKWKTYPLNNKKHLISEINYFEGQANGKFVYYQENGKILEEGSYTMGKRSGTWKKYDEQGNVSVTVKYQNDDEIRYDGTLTNTKEIGK